MADSPKSNSNENMKPSVLHPPIMKIDGPAEEMDKTDIEDDSKDACSLPKEEFKMCTATFRSSTMSTNNHLMSSPRTNRGILKPPQLSLSNTTTSSTTTTGSAKPFILKPSQLNPFAASKSSDACDNKNSERIENGDTNKQLNQVNGETPKFVPLIVSESKSTTTQVAETGKTVSNKPSPSNTSAAAAANSFVFGENLRERVIAAAESEESKPSTSLSTNGSTGMLFSTVIKNETKPTESATTTKDNKEVKTLSETAREYEELRANKRKYEEVEVVTGEENERNILNMSCKLFAFDKTNGTWQERGRGTLRLNDFEDEGQQVCSRLVFRTSGSLRVVLNTKIWAEMTVDKASEKSIRLTALDAQGDIKVFLIMTSIEDSSKLYSQLQSRLEREIAVQKRKKSENAAAAASGDN